MVTESRACPLYVWLPAWCCTRDQQKPRLAPIASHRAVSLKWSASPGHVLPSYLLNQSESEGYSRCSLANIRCTHRRTSLLGSHYGKNTCQPAVSSQRAPGGTCSSGRSQQRLPLGRPRESSFARAFASGPVHRITCTTIVSLPATARSPQRRMQ